MHKRQFFFKQIVTYKWLKYGKDFEQIGKIFTITGERTTSVIRKENYILNNHAERQGLLP